MTRSDMRRALPLTAMTLVELLVSMAVVSLLLVVLLSVTNQTGNVIKRTSGKIEQFREAREAFESITRKLSQATLNTYWDYDDPNAPTRYIRQSELRFLSGNMRAMAGTPPSGREWPAHGFFFQSPLGFNEAPASGSTQPDSRGLNSLLNTWGYFVEYGDDTPFRPSIVISSTKQRFRLCEFMQPTNELTIYNFTSGSDGLGKPKNLTYNTREWFTAALNSGSRPVHLLAENVIALIVLPKLSTQEDATGTKLAPSYSYDSTASNADPAINPKNQLPPVVQVTMVAMDEASAGRLRSQDYTEIQARLSALFSDASKYQTDLVLNAQDLTQSLEGLLASKQINYQIFTTNVILKGAKWSRAQKN